MAYAVPACDRVHVTGAAEEHAPCHPPRRPTAGHVLKPLARTFLLAVAEAALLLALVAFAASQIPAVAPPAGVLAPTPAALVLHDCPRMLPACR